MAVSYRGGCWRARPDPPPRHEAAFAETGFDAFACGDLWVSDAGRQRFPDGYWDALIADPPIVGMRAQT